MPTLGTGIHFFERHKIILHKGQELFHVIHIKLKKLEVVRLFFIVEMIKKPKRQLIKIIRETLTMLQCKDLTRHFSHIIKCKA